MRYAPIFLAGSVLFGQPALAQDVKLKPGDEFVSMISEAVMSVDFRSDAITFVAQRSRTEADFAVQVTFADGRPPQQCLAAPDLAGKLEGLSTLIVKRQIKQEQVDKDYPEFVGLLSVRSFRGLGGEYTIQTDSGGETVVALHEGLAAELVLRGADFAIFAKGCAFFGKK